MMGKHRVYTDQPLAGGTLTIHGEDAWHITGVLRLNAGDCVILCDGAEHECEAEIIRTAKNEVMLQLGAIEKTDTEPSIRVTLYQSLPKSDKMEWIVQKNIEVGISDIIPVITSRSIPAKPDNGKLDRWRKIAREAARQSGRGIIPSVRQSVELKNIKDAVQSVDLLLVAYEEENEQTLRNVLQGHPAAKNMGIFVGPEGGIAPEEVQMLQYCGGICVSLGKRILRTETAGLVMLSAILYEYGEMG